MVDTRARIRGWAAGARRLGIAASVSGRRVRRVGVLVAAAWLMACVVGATRADAYLYWVTWGNTTIARANLDGSAIDDAFIAPGGFITGVASDGRHVYWLDGRTGAIGRADPDGTNVDRDFIAGRPEPMSGFSGLSIGGGYLFWRQDQGGVAGVRTYLQSIWRAKLDGSGVPERAFYIPGQWIMNAFAADDSHVYWSAWDGVSRSSDAILRNNVDGSGEQKLITGTPGTAYAPAVAGGHIYWSFTGPPDLPGRIIRANVDGSAVTPDFIVTPGESPRDVAVGHGYVYWVVWGTGPQGVNSIARAKLDGTGVNHRLLTGINPDLRGLAVDGLSPPPAPTINGLTVAPSAMAATWWRPRSVAPARRRRVGATVRYRLSMPATVRFTVERRVSGRRDEVGRCVANLVLPRPQSTCTTTVTVPGDFTVKGTRGANRFWFSGRIGGRALRLGDYRLTATVAPEDSRTSPAHADFWVVPLRNRGDR